MTLSTGNLVEYELVGEEYIKPPSYVFQSQFGLVDFIIIQEEMEQLHEYCFLCLESTTSKLNGLVRNLEDYSTGAKVAEDPEMGDITLLVVDGLREFEIPRWSETQAFLVNAMCLLLLSSLAERSLKSLCISLSPAGINFKHPNKSMSKTAAYIFYLQHSCGLAFEEPADAASVRENCRVMRNDFAHGDWDAVRTNINAQPLRKAFEAYAILFEKIESAYELMTHNKDSQT